MLSRLKALPGTLHGLQLFPMVMRDDSLRSIAPLKLLWGPSGICRQSELILSAGSLNEQQHRVQALAWQTIVPKFTCFKRSTLDKPLRSRGSEVFWALTQSTTSNQQGASPNFLGTIHSGGSHLRLAVHSLEERPVTHSSFENHCWWQKINRRCDWKQMLNFEKSERMLHTG